jgi:uncharacterized protein YbaP (TraB family)
MPSGFLRAAANGRLLWAALLLAAAMAPAGAQASCYGRDLFAYYRLFVPAQLDRIEAEAQRLPFAHGRLFRLSRAGVAPSYLFGTLHFADHRLAIPKEAESALRSSAVLALEFAIDGGGRPPDHIGLDSPVLQATAASRPDVLLRADAFARLEQIVVAHGLPADAARLLKPEVLALTLDLPRCAASLPGRGDYLDAMLAREALRRGEPIVGLESFEEQIDALGGMTAREDRDLLLSLIVAAPFGVDGVETSIRRYLRGDLGELLAWSKGPILWPGLVVSNPPAAFLDRLLDRRSARLYQRALPLVAKGGAFIAVGAAHIPGARGLAQRFLEGGYQVTAVDPDK